MAYGLKYKASKTHENGDKYEVRIYRDGWTGASYGIGNLTRLSLSIQGDTAALTAPIIKTSLNIGMIDTPDKGSTKSDGTTCVDANGDKVGKWEEFYTNNPTLYKVELRYTGALTRNAVIWTGFLTPDSWGEDMTYGGTISLVARDMLGTLSEYEFDLTGDVTITQIVQGALTKCKCAMTATMRTSECLQNAGNSQSILTAKINASTFAGKNWYEALEQTLEGVGLILRYDGNNGFDCTSIRYAASHAVEGGENAHTPAFYNRSGYRTLDPAVKQIIEVFNPKIESIAPVEPSAEDWTDTGQTLTQHYEQGYPLPSDITYPKYTLAEGNSYFSGSGAIPYLDSRSEGAPNVPKVGIYFPVNLTSTTDYTTYKDPHLIAPFVLNFASLVNTSFVVLTTANSRMYFDRYFFDDPVAVSVKIAVSCKLNGTTYYWNKGWNATTATFFDLELGNDLTVAEKEGATDYAVHICCVNASTPKDVGGVITQPLFVPLNIGIVPIDGNDVYGEYKTTTIYDEENHIEINRTPSIGAINSSTPAAFLPNVLHYGTTPAADKWRWAGENSAGLPLAVVIHQQLLVFNCAQNGNSVFTGDLLDVTYPVSVPGTNYNYYQRKCALLAGDYNCLSGYIEGVTLREIYDWDDVWDGVTPEYTEKESQAKGGTAASGGGGSSSGGGGGSSHTHPNKEVLDGITAEKVTDWDDAYDHTSLTNNPHSVTWAQVKTAGCVVTADIADSAITTAKIGDKQVTIDKLSQAVQDILGYFTLEGEGTAASPYYLHTIYNLCSDNEITAGGVGTGGGGGGGIVALYAKTSGNDVRLDDTETRQAKFGISVNGSLVTPTNGVFNINTSGGSVTSVGLSVPTGFTTGQPVTSSGNLTLGFASGYSLPTTAKQTSWDNKQNALGYTPVNKAGDTMSGSLELFATGSSWNEGIRMHLASNNWVGLVMCGSDNTGATGTSAKTWSIHNYDGHAYFVNNGSSAYTYGFDWTNGGALTMKASSMAFNVRPTVNGTNVALTSDIPTDNLYLANGANYITSSGSCAYATNAGQLNGRSDYYNPSNANRTDTPWYASSLTLNGAISGATSISASGIVSDKGSDYAEYYINQGWYRVAVISYGNLTADFWLSNGWFYVEPSPIHIQICRGVITVIGHSGGFISKVRTVSVTGSSDIAVEVYSVSPQELLHIRALGGSLTLYKSTTAGSDSGTLAEVSVGSGIVCSSNIVGTGEVTAGQSSDRRFKDNQQLLRNADRVLKSLRPMEFDWNDLYHSLGGQNRGHDVGFLAQDIQPLIPSAIGKVYGDYLRLDYNKVTPYLVSGWQSHEKRIEYLERRVNELERQLHINS